MSEKKLFVQYGDRWNRSEVENTLDTLNEVTGDDVKVIGLHDSFEMLDREQVEEVVEMLVAELEENNSDDS